MVLARCYIVTLYTAVIDSGAEALVLRETTIESIIVKQMQFLGHYSGRTVNC